jgi:hypothetical protein
VVAMWPWEDALPLSPLNVIICKMGNKNAYLLALSGRISGWLCVKYTEFSMY